MFSDWKDIIEENIEIIELNEGKNIPNDKKKWSYAKSQAKKKFKKWPSAYASSWAAKKYKELGGTWKKKSKK
jgi:hypothetical protein